MISTYPVEMIKRLEDRIKELEERIRDLEREKEYAYESSHEWHDTSIFNDPF